MPAVDVREFNTRASEIVRDLRGRRAHYVITYRGRPVGVLLPLEDIAQAQAMTGAEAELDAWDELTRLGEEIGRGWQSPLTSIELLSDIRR